MEDTEYEYDLERSGRKGGAAMSPAEARLKRDTEIYPEEWTEPEIEEEPGILGLYGADVIDAGLTSDASVSGMGVDLDDLPGDEPPIKRR